MFVFFYLFILTRAPKFIVREIIHDTIYGFAGLTNGLLKRTHTQFHLLRILPPPGATFVAAHHTNSHLCVTTLIVTKFASC